MPAGMEDKPVEAKGGECSLLGWLIKPFPNSQEGNWGCEEETYGQQAKWPAQILPGSVKVIPALMAVLLKVETSRAI